MNLSNRIVVDYHGERKLVLLAVTDESGAEKDWDFTTDVARSIGCETPKKYSYDTIDELKDFDWDNAEGFVIAFRPSNIRCKIKFPTYVSLHKVVTGLNERGVWEILKNGGNVNDAIEGAPDELFKWVSKVVSDLSKEYQKIEHEYIRIFADVKARLNALYLLDGTKPERKDFAIDFQSYKHPSILFDMLDERDYSQIIWKILRPAVDPSSMGLGGKVVDE